MCVCVFAGVSSCRVGSMCGTCTPNRISFQCLYTRAELRRSCGVAGGGRTICADDIMIAKRLKSTGEEKFRGGAGPGVLMAIAFANRMPSREQPSSASDRGHRRFVRTCRFSLPPKKTHLPPSLILPLLCLSRGRRQ